MRRHEITEIVWERIKRFLPGQPGDPGVTAKDKQTFSGEGYLEVTSKALRIE